MGNGDCGRRGIHSEYCFWHWIYALTGSEGAAEFGTTSIVAPIIEEGLKGLAVLIVFFLFRKEFELDSGWDRLRGHYGYGLCRRGKYFVHL